MHRGPFNPRFVMVHAVIIKINGPRHGLINRRKLMWTRCNELDTLISGAILHEGYDVCLRKILN